MDVLKIGRLLAIEALGRYLYYLLEIYAQFVEICSS